MVAGHDEDAFFPDQALDECRRVGLESVPGETDGAGLRRAEREKPVVVIEPLLQDREIGVEDAPRPGDDAFAGAGAQGQGRQTVAQGG
jgi:hypothetical protein